MKWPHPRNDLSRGPAALASSAECLRETRDSTPRAFRKAIFIALFAALVILAQHASAKKLFTPAGDSAHASFTPCGSACTAESGIGPGVTSVAERNHESGYVGVVIATNMDDYDLFAVSAAEAVQRVYVTAPANGSIHWRAVMYRTGGTVVAGSGGKAGTDRVWYNGSTRHVEVVDPPWTFADFVNIAMDVATALLPGGAADAVDAITQLSGVTFAELINEFLGLYDTSDMQKIVFEDNFYGYEGESYRIDVGLRAQASAVAWPVGGDAEALSFGVVESILVWGVGGPPQPQIEGPSTGYDGEVHAFRAFNTNEDCLANDLSELSYQFLWGDGHQTDWTNPIWCGRPEIRSHEYSTPGTYIVEVRVKDMDDGTISPDPVSTHTIEVRSSDPPAGLPADFAASQNAHCTNVYLSWSPVGGDVTRYELDRRDPTDWTALPLSAPLDLSYTDSDPLPAGSGEKRRRYRVRACNPSSCTQDYSYAYGWPTLLPAPPRNVRATDWVCPPVIITWSPSIETYPDNPIDGDAYGYTVWRAETNSTASVDPEDVANPAVKIGTTIGVGNTYFEDNDTSLSGSEDVYYHYWVRAFNECSVAPEDPDGTGFSGHNSGMSVGRLKDKPSDEDAPQGVRIEQQLNGCNFCDCVKISWLDDSRWEYYVLGDGQIASDPLAVAGTRVYYRDYDVQPWQSHSYTVQARGECDSYPYSPKSSPPVTGQAAADPDPVTNLAATQATRCDGVQITWDQVPHADRYEIDRDSNLLGQPTGTSYFDTPPNLGQIYTYTVRAQNACCGDGEEEETSGSVVDCNDGAFCNGLETCVGSSCQPGTPPAVDDGVDCTDDSCDEGTDAVVHTPVHALCLDDDACNGAETCHATLGCQPGAPLVCDDSDVCTADRCKSSSGCQFDVSCADPSCNLGICERPAEITCADAFDNDGDGVPDCADLDCTGFDSCEYGTELTCVDAFDNDSDGNADCVDSDCGSAEKCIAFTGNLSLRQGSLFYPIARGGALTGAGIAAISGTSPYPISVRVPQRALVAQTAGSLTTSLSPYVRFGTRASFANESGLLAWSSDPGPVTWLAYGSAPTPVGTATVTPNPSPFGGTLRLLGSLSRQTTRATTMGTVMASQGLPLENVGTGEFSTYVAATGTYGGNMTTARAWGARWTAGFLTVWTQSGSYLSTNGYDNRTPSGRYGTLRLVSPRLVATGLPPQTMQPGFAVLELHFAPEPAAGIALAAGLLGVVLLWRIHRRASRRR
jgi:hypothetical protein